MYLKSIVRILLGTTAQVSAAQASTTQMPMTQVSTMQAALVHSLDDLKVIEVPLSQTGLTRITVKGDRINNVFGVAGEYVMEADETQGQVFIRPMEPALNPISITVTTEGGHTQDLRLIPQNKAPEAIILKIEDANKAKEKGGQVGLDNGLSRNEIEELLHACVEGRIPTSYKSVPLKIPSDNNSHHLIGEISNNKLRGLTYEIKNSGTIPLILAESGFAQNLDVSVVAILMPKKLLHPGESTHVCVAAKSL